MTDLILGLVTVGIFLIAWFLGVLFTAQQILNEEDDEK